MRAKNINLSVGLYNECLYQELLTFDGSYREEIDIVRFQECKEEFQEELMKLGDFSDVEITLYIANMEDYK